MNGRKRTGQQRGPVHAVPSWISSPATPRRGAPGDKGNRSLARPLWPAIRRHRASWCGDEVWEAEIERAGPPRFANRSWCGAGGPWRRPRVLPDDAEGTAKNNRASGFYRGQSLQLCMHGKPVAAATCGAGLETLDLVCGSNGHDHESTIADAGLAPSPSDQVGSSLVICSCVVWSPSGRTNPMRAWRSLKRRGYMSAEERGEHRGHMLLKQQIRFPSRSSSLVRYIPFIPFFSIFFLFFFMFFFMLSPL